MIFLISTFILGVTFVIFNLKGFQKLFPTVIFLLEVKVRLQLHLFI